MRVNGSLAPWRRHTTSYLVPAHPAGARDHDRANNADEALAQPLPREVATAFVSPLDDEREHATYLSGWRDGFTAGYRAGLARGQKRGPRKDDPPATPVTVIPRFDARLRDRLRYHL